LVVARIALSFLVVVAALAAAGVARAEDDASAPRVDASALPGPFIAYHARPSLPARACSARVPVCVHFTPKDAPRDALDAFERAWAVLTGALGVPAPELGIDSVAYDVFLHDGETETLLEARDMRSRVDRGRAFTLLDRRMRASCMLDAAAASAIARASLLRTAPATEEGTARAQARMLANLAFPCAVAFDTDAMDSQAHPEHEVVEPGASVFWNRIDWAFGRQPGGIALAAQALHPTMTAPAALRWNNEPDTFDVLRLTFKNALSTGSTVNDLWLDFGVARYFVGDREGGGGGGPSFHIPELRALGAAGDVPLAWDIPWPTKPRRLAPKNPVAPTGASYLMIQRAGAKAGSRLRVEIEWEEHALFRWAFVKLDREGHELARVVIPSRERATETSMTLADLDTTDRVLLVGVNTGDPAYAFDPDDETLEPHAWLVTVAEE
jgi:hypothetical protein